MHINVLEVIMKRILIMYAISVFFFFTNPTVAMMGGSGGMGGHMGGGSGWGGQGGNNMPNNRDYYIPPTERPPAYNRYGRRNNRAAMAPEVAEDLVHEYMDRKTSQPYQLDKIQDKGSYYMSDVLHPDGKRMDRLLIDKETGKIHSITD
jgi:hypothetical protein